MIPIHGKYAPFCSGLDPRAFCLNTYNFTPYQQWIPSGNFTQPINNYVLPTSIFTNKPYQLLSTQEIEQQFNHYVDKKQEQICTSKFEKAQNNVKEEDQQCLINKIQNEEESSYSNKRKRNRLDIKKTKQAPQNKNRNIIPSIIQQMLTYITKHIKSKSVCEQVFKNIQIPEDIQISISRYYSYLREVRQNQNHYVNPSTLKILILPQNIGIDLYSKPEQQFYLKVARILAKHFLLKVSPFLTIHSKRIVKQKKHDHLQVRRFILKLIQNLKI